MIDVYNEKMAKFADEERHIFTATFIKPYDRLAIFKDLRIDDQESDPVINKIALHYTKTFKDLDLIAGDVVQFQGIVKKNNKDEYTIERPNKAEKIASAPREEDQNGFHVVSDDWDWFE